MISEKLLEIVRCPVCGDRLEHAGDHLSCPKSGDIFELSEDSRFLDMRPSRVDQKESVYGDEEFVQARGQMEPGPPFLSGGIKNWVLKSMMNFKKNDLVLDAGSGPGRYILWNLKSGAHFVGLDQEPFFSSGIVNKADLVRGYLHYLPFREGTLNSIITLDVLEHMALGDIKKFLAGSAAALKPDGRLFIYTNSTESSALAPIIRFRQKITEFFARRGLVDFKIEKESKEDHLNAIIREEDLINHAGEAGLKLVNSCYYNPVIMGWFENLLLKILEHRINKKSGSASGSAKSKSPGAKARMKEKTKKKGLHYWAFYLITLIMKLDILLFAGIKSGQFFHVYKKSD